MKFPESHLGGGVHVSYDRGRVTLRHGHSNIALDPDAIERLAKYCNTIADIIQKERESDGRHQVPEECG